MQQAVSSSRGRNATEHAQWRSTIVIGKLLAIGMMEQLSSVFDVLDGGVWRKSWQNLPLAVTVVARQPQRLPTRICIVMSAEPWCRMTAGTVSWQRHNNTYVSIASCIHIARTCTLIQFVATYC